MSPRHCPLENECLWVEDPDCDKWNYEFCIAYEEHQVMLADVPKSEQYKALEQYNTEL